MSLEKMDYLIDSNYHCSNFYPFINAVTNADPHLIRRLFTSSTFIFPNELILEIYKLGYYNIIDAIFQYNKTTFFNSESLQPKSQFNFIDLLLNSMSIGSECIFNCCFEIVQPRYNVDEFKNLVSNNCYQIYQYLNKTPLPIDIYKRVFFLNCLDKIFKHNQNGSTALYDSFIQHALKRDFLKNGHSQAYLLNLNDKDLSKIGDHYSKKFIKYILSSNNSCLINGLKDTISADLDQYLGYLLKKNKFSSKHTQLIKLMPPKPVYNNQNENEDYIITLLFHLIFQTKNYNLLNYILSIGRYGNNNFYNEIILKHEEYRYSIFKDVNYYLNYCHIQILTNSTVRAIGYPITEYLLSINYKYSPTKVTPNEVYSIIPSGTVDKISSSQTLSTFIDNIGLSQYFKTTNNGNQIFDNLPTTFQF